MKARSQFASFSWEDQKHILDLCARHSYHEAVNILRKPRAEGGLEIVTSTAALCRFFSTAQPDPQLAVLAQSAAATNIRHEQHSNAFLGAIRATVEARVLESLRSGRALADMEKEFRFLKIVEKIYLADAEWRAVYPEAARAAYQDHVNRCADNSDIDFIPINEIPADQVNETISDLEEPSEFENDILAARQRQKANTASKAELLASIRTAFGQLNNLQTGNREHPEPSKGPVIPHIPLNSTNPRTANPQISEEDYAPAPSEPMKPTPYISPAPKISRNAPCPCGSGRKSKRCCHP